MGAATPALAEPAPAQPAVTAPAATVRVFATREGLVGQMTANGHIIQPRDRFVALPSWSALSTLGGHEYQVRITYKGRSAIAPVWDVGPWNSHDDYWGPARQRYPDLPVGLPMAQAAYQNGYNGGRDEYGRRIVLPNGIDIADGTFWDDLGMTDSDWVEVSFLWLGADTGPTGSTTAAQNPNAGPPDTADAAFVADNGGDWYDASNNEWYVAPCGRSGNHNWTYSTAVESTASHSASWTAQLPRPGFYEVLAYIPDCGPPASTSAHYTIGHDGATSEVVRDQQAAAGGWASLGTYHFTPGSPAVVALRDLADSGMQALRFDAVKWVPRSDTAAPQSQLDAVAPLDDGGFLVQWQGSDDASGVRSYDLQWRQLPDGAWADWHLDTPITQDRFVPPSAGRYGFRVRARDWADNLETYPDAPQAATE